MASNLTAAVRTRRARYGDRERMLEIWERSVRATHSFLGERDIRALRPLVAQELADDAADWWVTVSTDDAPIAFLAYSRGVIEGLFIDPAFHRRGVGTQLVEHAQQLGGGALTVDVNEQNHAALQFYSALGFTAAGRSDTDGAGRAFPLLHLRRPAP